MPQFIPGILNKDIDPGSSQSTLVELCFWTAAFFLYTNVASRIIRRILSRTKIWQGHVKRRQGIFCANAQDELVLEPIILIHHTLAGSVCARGVLSRNADIWRHGYLMNTGFELADLLAMAIPSYPYRLDNIKPEIQKGMLFHHLPGVFFCLVFLQAGFQHNTNVQKITLWFLMGSGANVVATILILLLNPAKQMPLMTATAIAILGTAFWIYCRFYAFAKEAILLMQGVNSDPEWKGSWLVQCLYAAGIFFTLFNLAIVADVIPKTIRMAKRCIDGVTPLDNKVVPLSREDRQKKSMNANAEVGERNKVEKCQ